MAPPFLLQGSKWRSQPDCFRRVGRDCGVHLQRVGDNGKSNWLIRTDIQNDGASFVSKVMLLSNIMFLMG